MSRLTPLEREQLTDAQQQVYDTVLASRGNLTGPFAAWLHSPELANRTQHLGEYVRFRSSLPPALSEFVILRVARHFDCELEWAIHEPIARQQGLAVDTIDAVFAGKTISDSTPELGVVDRYVVELLRTNRVSASTFHQAVALLGEASVVELTILIGYYTLVAFSINAFLLPVPPDVTPRLPWDSDSQAGNMAMPEKVVVELPSRLAAELASANQALITDLLQRGLRDLHVEQALDRYQQGGMSFAAAAEQAGVSVPELARAAYVRNIEPPFDQEMVAEELQ